MKWRLYVVALMVAAFVTTACSDDDDRFTADDVPVKVMEAFKAKYPDTIAHWEKERGRIKAEFVVNGQETEAWFETDGTWIGTETDFRGTLPDAVRSLIETEYAGYTIDDVDWVETPSVNYFSIELERHGKPDVRLLIKEDGTLLG